jgi:hypothetical protein
MFPTSRGTPDAKQQMIRRPQSRRRPCRFRWRRGPLPGVVGQMISPSLVGVTSVDPISPKDSSGERIALVSEPVRGRDWRGPTGGCRIGLGCRRQ